MVTGLEGSQIERRLRALEDIEAIKALKSRYLACCDAKDPAGMRACFADGPVRIDYGAVGVFDRADAVVEVFRQVGCHDYMVEMHHGSNPRIELAGADHAPDQAPDQARGHWNLHYQLINTRENTLTQLGGVYEDEYRRTPQGWKIAATKFAVNSMLVLKLDAAAVQALVVGRMPAPPATEARKAG